jgi:hypothetical protein
MTAALVLIIVAVLFAPALPFLDEMLAALVLLGVAMMVSGHSEGIMFAIALLVVIGAVRAALQDRPYGN